MDQRRVHPDRRDVARRDADAAPWAPDVRRRRRRGLRLCGGHAHGDRARQAERARQEREPVLHHQRHHHRPADRSHRGVRHSGARRRRRRADGGRVDARGVPARQGRLHVAVRGARRLTAVGRPRPEGNLVPCAPRCLR
ncbi:hypothetical protein CXX93_07880 [Gordonia sp. YC-JH1]|nr:hypothetical protein CXX93_07880 [Gordonia sp. YC-JH1]